MIPWEPGDLLRHIYTGNFLLVLDVKISTRRLKWSVRYLDINVRVRDSIRVWECDSHDFIYWEVTKSD